MSHILIKTLESFVNTISGSVGPGHPAIAKWPHVGDVVVLREDTQVPTCWRIACVMKTYMGGDGLVHVCQHVKTASGNLHSSQQFISLMNINVHLIM